MSVIRTLALGPFAAVAVLCLALSRTDPSASQGRPSFAGRWISVPPQEVGAAWCSLGSPLTLTQDTQSLTAEWVSGSRSHAPVKLIYNFNGTERRNPELNGAAPFERLTRAVWKDQQLVLTTVWARENPGPIEITDVLTLTSPDSFSGEMTSRFIAKVEPFKDSTRTGKCTYRRAS
jgi:hypothetical protein